MRSSKRWFIRFRVEVWSIEEDEAEPSLLFTHDFDPTDRDVLIQFPVGTLGDTLAWFSYAARFADDHPECRVTCILSSLIIPLLRDMYPNLRLLTHEELIEQDLAAAMYATYSLGLFFEDTASEWQPTDFRHVGLHRTAAYILGVAPAEVPPRVTADPGDRPIAEPYVCIGVQSSTQCKVWNNPHGWHAVVAFLKSHGYRVICIDQKPVHGAGLVLPAIARGSAMAAPSWI